MNRATRSSDPAHHGLSDATADQRLALPGNWPFSLDVDMEAAPHPLPWIPIQTARAVHAGLLLDPAYAQGTDEVGVVDLGKVVSTPEGPDVEQLTASDWAELHRAWLDLPRLRLPLREKAFAPYRTAFERHIQPQPFQIEPLWGRIATEIFLMLQHTAHGHELELRRWVEDGRVMPRSCGAALPAPREWRAGSGLMLDDLQAFCRSLGIDVRAKPVGTEGDDTKRAFEERRELLEKFRSLGGALASEGEAGRRGALAELERQIGRKRQSFMPRLIRAIEEESLYKPVTRASPKSRSPQLWNAWSPPKKS